MKNIRHLVIGWLFNEGAPWGTAQKIGEVSHLYFGGNSNGLPVIGNFYEENWLLSLYGKRHKTLTLSQVIEFKRFADLAARIRLSHFIKFQILRLLHQSESFPSIKFLLLIFLAVCIWSNAIGFLPLPFQTIFSFYFISKYISRKLRAHSLYLYTGSMIWNPYE